MQAGTRIIKGIGRGCGHLLKPGVIYPDYFEPIDRLRLVAAFLATSAYNCDKNTTNPVRNRILTMDG